MFGTVLKGSVFIIDLASSINKTSNVTRSRIISDDPGISLQLSRVRDMTTDS